MSPRASHRRRDSGRILGYVLLGAVVLAIGGTIVLQAEKRPESTPVSRGEKLAQRAGCFACHGRGDGEPRFNLRQVNGKWALKNNPTFWDNSIDKTSVLVDWVTNGVPAAQATRHKSLFIQMPAYKDRLKPQEIQDIAAWILSDGLKYTQGVGEKAKPVTAKPGLTGDALLVAGDRLSRKFGCYQCHGELGQGGVSNPDSFKGYIPSFAGEDLRKLTANGDRDEILHWIDTGHGRAIESGLTGQLAKKYVEGQATKMPAYKDQLSDAEKALLADYVLLLNKKGPLPAPEIERLFTLLDEE